MERRYFGTDGIRGRVGEYPITPDFVLRLGWAAGRVLAHRGRNQVLIGKDTRLSGYMFESALEAGLSAAGANIQLLGPMPTPGIAYLTRTFHASAGIVISASHNPYYDNGIKFFSDSGTKIPDEIEYDIETLLDQELSIVDSSKLGKADRLSDATGRYIEFCKSTLSKRIDLSGIHMVVDCANGATYQIAPRVFEELGAKVSEIGVDPDGMNINVDCGSTNPRSLQDAVIRNDADVGVALDGDGDRVIMVDQFGDVVDGDELLFIIALSRKRNGRLSGDVVGTLMSNLGLELALRAEGIGFRRSKVGDRYVLEMLHGCGALLGGESSGHIICLDRTTTGDGIVAALQVLGAMVETGSTLGDIKTRMRKYPQCVVNVPLPYRFDVANSTRIADAVRDVEATLGENGRVLLRPSGTEPVVRVMVEGPDDTQIRTLAEGLAAAVGEAVEQQGIERGEP